MIDVIVVVMLAKALVLALGGVITHLAYRAYRGTRSPALRGLTLGFAAITAGAFLGGGFDRLLGLRLAVGVLAQSTLTAAGFAVVAWSLYAAPDAASVRER
jgi:hypothetical protein